MWNISNSIIKKNKWETYPNYIICANIKNNLIDNKIYDDNFDLILRYRLNKNNIYESSQIIIEHKENKNIVGIVILDDSKIEYMDSPLRKYNIPKNEISLNNIKYLDQTYKKDIENIIIDIKNKINNVNKTENTVIKEKNNVIVDEFEKNEFNDEAIEKWEKNNKNKKNININILDDTSSLITKYLNIKEGNNLEKNKLLLQIQKVYKNFNEKWIVKDKQELLGIIKSNNNICIEKLIKQFGRDKSGIMKQIRKLIEDYKIDEPNINKNIIGLL